MNENIGVKGTGKDYRRTIIIKRKELVNIKKQCEKINKKELEELEKKVKILQIITFLKVIPLVVTTGFIKTIVTDNFTKNKKNISSENIDEKENIISEEIKNDNLENEEQVEENSSDIKQDNQTKKEEKTIKEEFKKSKSIPKINIKKSVEVVLPSLLIEKVYEETKKLDKIKNKKIIKTYENKLKDTKIELKIIADDIITETDNKSYEEIEKLISKINIVIKKLESLNKKININKNDYDDESIYFLIEEYTKEFKNKKIVDDIKDSNLYIALSMKLDELEKEKDNIKKKVKSSVKEKSKDLEEDYFDFKEVNKEFNKFQNKENQIAESYQENNKKQKEKKKSNNDYVEQNIKIKTLNKEVKTLNNLINQKTFIRPSIRNTNVILTATLTNIFFMNKILRNRFFKRKRKILKRTEYSKFIENTPSNISNTTKLLKLTTKKVDNLITEIKANLNKYNTNEYQELLLNLENIKRIIQEKEYELEQIKENNKQKIKVKIIE